MTGGDAGGHGWYMEHKTSAETDRAGLEILPFDACLQRLASVPVGRVGFINAGEVVILPVNHVVDGHSVVFRTDVGSKLASTSLGYPITFEVDAYDAASESGWSVLLQGWAEVVEDDAEIRRLDTLGLRSWPRPERPYWVRISPFLVTGRQIPRRLPGLGSAVS